MKKTETPALRVSDEARRYIDNHPLYKQACALHALISLTLDEVWRPDPETPYGGDPRTDAELEEARQLQPVYKYLKDLQERARLRVKRRSALAYREFMAQSQEPIAA